MNELVKEKWILALRSGEYKQGKSCLANPEKEEYCCLGVLCEISPFAYDPSDISLPGNVVNWAGLQSVQPQISAADEPDLKNKFNYYSVYNLKLAHLNDAGCNFERIADLIEKYL